MPARPFATSVVRFVPHSSALNAQNSGSSSNNHSSGTYIIETYGEVPIFISAPITLLCTAGLVGALAYVDAWRKTRAPKLQMAQTAFNATVLARCPTLFAPYKPTPFLTNGHVETIFASKFRSKPKITYTRECLAMPDGGTVALDWEQFSEDGVQALPPSAPVLILLPGLTGGSCDSYVLHAVERARQRGIRAVVFNSRGTADSPVTSPQFYSASFTDDMRAVVAHVAAKYPGCPLLAAGWSLGANILVRYLGEEGAATPLKAAVSMCNPFDLALGNANFEVGINRIYDLNLAQSLKRIFAKHRHLFEEAQGPVDPERVMASTSIKEFDEALTIHSFGWESVDAYYAGSSSSLSVPHVAIPLLCIQALDDPIAPKEAIPYEALAANPHCVLVETPCGGHLGWVSGKGSPRGHPWSDNAVMEWLQSVLVQLRQPESAAPAASAAAAGGAAAGAADGAQPGRQEKRGGAGGGDAAGSGDAVNVTADSGDHAGSKKDQCSETSVTVATDTTTTTTSTSTTGTSTTASAVVAPTTPPPVKSGPRHSNSSSAAGLKAIPAPALAALAGGSSSSSSSGKGADAAAVNGSSSSSSGEDEEEAQRCERTAAMIRVDSLRFFGV